MFSTYLENGLGIIPIRWGKNPGFKEWQIFCERKPTEKEIEIWQREFDAKIFTNIGLPCGVANQIIAVDIDDEDPEIAKLVPPSLVRKRGRKGETRFFRYHESLPSEKIYRWRNGVRSAAPSVEILSTGNQTVLPPSIHPDTGFPYIWLTEDTLPEFAATELPAITSADLEVVRNYLSNEMLASENKKLEVKYNDDPSRSSPHGAQDQLKIVAAALIAKGTGFDAAVEELLATDRRLHPSGGYFYEYGRTSDQRADPVTNAINFYAGVMKSTNIKRLREGKPVEVPTQVKAISEIDLSKLMEEKSQPKKPYPSARGFMLEFQECCKMQAHGDQEALSLGGAIALMAALLSNKFVSKVGPHIVTPNVYVLNLGHSAFGKELAQRLVAEFISQSHLLGASSYRSGTSIIQDLAKRQERLDIIDEASALLKSMNSDNNYQQEIVEILSSLFSKASSRYHGITSAGKGSRQGACWNPHVSILASTNPTGFKESVSHGLQAKGLMPRFLTFVQELTSDYKRLTKADAEKIEFSKKSIQQYVNQFLEMPKMAHAEFRPNPNLIAQDEGVRFSHKEIPFTPEAEDAFFEMAAHYHGLSMKDPDGFESAFFGRLAELACKLALLDAVSLAQSTITPYNFAWAREVVEVQWEHIKSLYQLTSVETPTQGFLLRILQIIKKNPGIKHRDLTRRTQWVNSDLRRKIIQDLIESEQIEILYIIRHNQKVPTYSAI